MKIPFKQIKRRFQINGFELPFIGGGVSWNITPSEKDVAEKFLIYLADRRALYNDWHLEIEYQVVRSVLDIRERITKDLQEIDPNSKLFQVMRQMQIACQTFLTYTRDVKPDFGFHPTWDRDQIDFYIELGKLRSTFGHCIASIAIQYEIDIDARLEPLLPNYSK